MRSILLIENTNLVSIKFKITLKKFGYEHIEVLSGPELTLAESERIIRRAKIIFIDSDNRENNTEKIIQHIRKISKKNKLVLITSQGKASFVKSLLSYGGDDVLAKPYSDFKLMEKVFKYDKEPTTDDSEAIDSQVIVEDNGRFMPEWNEDLALGFESIDLEHKGLIEQYENLYQRMKTGNGEESCLELIDYLENYVKTHFENEEKIFDSIKYNDENNHKLMHDKFRKKIAVIAEEFRHHSIDNHRQVTFNLFIKKWLMYHILVEDRKYIAFYQSQKKKEQVNGGQHE